MCETKTCGAQSRKKEQRQLQRELLQTLAGLERTRMAVADRATYTSPRPYDAGVKELRAAFGIVEPETPDNELPDGVVEHAGLGIRSRVRRPGGANLGYTPGNYEPAIAARRKEQSIYVPTPGDRSVSDNQTDEDDGRGSRRRDDGEPKGGGRGDRRASAYVSPNAYDRDIAKMRAAQR